MLIGTLVLDYRSHTPRSFRAVAARPLGRALGLALALAAVGGCQSNSERDLIARERRMQEDQIYALQDYVTQYQQLLCRYRQENSALRQQMAGGYVVEPQPSPPPPPRTRNGRQAPNTSPRFQPPRTPNKEQQTPRATQPDIDAPDIPPLNSANGSEASAEIAAQDVPPASESELQAHESELQAHEVEPQLNEVEPQDVTTPRVLTAAYDEPVAQQAIAGEADSSTLNAANTAAADPISEPPAAPHPPTSDILLSGEVVANDAGGGPRLVVDVEPFDASGRVELFAGRLSLMLLVHGSDGELQNLGRWDFTPNQVRDAIDERAGEPTMRFFIELPAEAPVVGPTKLWVRLLAPDGSRRLAHANVELSRPGVFSSRTEKIWATEEAVVAASYTEPAPPTTDFAATMNDGEWAVAEPGKPANLPAAEQEDSGSGWRASNEPMPGVIATSSPAPPNRALDNPLRPLQRPPVATTTEPPARKPDWSPDRSGKPSRRVATRPSWSSTR
jgi:hypothetical protein